MRCIKRTTKIQLSLDVVGSGQVCRIGQQIVPILFTMKLLEIWKFGQISDARSKFVAVSGCLNSTLFPGSFGERKEPGNEVGLNSEVTKVEVFNTVCHSHRTIIPIQHLHIINLVIRVALLTLKAGLHVRHKHKHKRKH